MKKEKRIKDMEVSKRKRVVLVTGGSRGIGRAIVARFAALGDTVVLNYRSSVTEAETVQTDLAASGAEVVLAQADVADAGQTRRMVDDIVRQHGRIDVLVNNAGITRDGLLMLMPDEDWSEVLSVNLNGVFHASRAVASHMIGQRSGAIVNVSSLSGITGLPGQTNYAAAKGGVISFTRALSKELARFGIRVNAVAPGVIETDIVSSLSEPARKAFLETIPLRRFGTADEVASVVAFLASEDASYITGETLCITGGLP